jgi:integrase
MSRRAAGEGSIYKLPNGRWRGTVELPSPDGRRRRKTATGETRRDVADRLTILRRAVQDGSIALGPDMTVEAWLTHWLATAKLRTSTRQGYESKIRVNVVPHIGRVRLDRLQPEHLEALYAKLSTTLAPATVRQVHAILRRALRVAEQRRRITRNPAALVQSPSVPHREAVALTREQAHAVLDAVSTRRSAARWQVALAMGLRQGEALGLCWDAVDLTAGTLRVEAELVWVPNRHGCDVPCGEKARHCPDRVAGRHVLEEPKSARSRRTLPLPTQLVDALKAWRKTQLEERIALGEKWQGFAIHPAGGTDAVTVDLVFAQPNGRPINSRADWGDWQEILDEAGVPRMGTHGGRHTTATLMLEAGVPLKVVQEVLGHSSFQLTADVYSHVGDTLKRGAADSIGASLFSR